MKWLLTVCMWSLTFTTTGATYEERAVASVLMGEAWSDGFRGMTAVAEVIHQRSLEKGKSPLQVISAHRRRVHAFSCLNGTTLDRLIQKFARQPDFKGARRLAETVCQSPSSLPGLSKAANHYTRANETPYWARGTRPVAIIGSHAFYKLEY